MNGAGNMSRTRNRSKISETCFHTPFDGSRSRNRFNRQPNQVQVVTTSYRRIISGSRRCTPSWRKYKRNHSGAPLERFRYLRLVDAKSNFAPRAADSPWYRLNSVALPNAEPPVYPHGDNVQVIERVTSPLVKDAAALADELKVKRALLDLIHRGEEIDGKYYPYSSSFAGAKNERSLLQDAIHVIRGVMAVGEGQADYLEFIAKNHINTMSNSGWLVVGAMAELVSDPGRFRKGRGLKVVWAMTPWPKAAADQDDRSE